MQAQTDTPFADHLPSLLAERGLSQRKLAQMIDMNPSHLSRALRGADRARPSVELIRRVTRALDLPSGYFPEMREAALFEALKRNPALRDKLYRQLHVDDL